MRFSAGSSSSSLASATDSLPRKSPLCLYTPTTDPPSLHSDKMDGAGGSEAMELRRELEAVRGALQAQSETVLRQRHRLVEAEARACAADARAAREHRARRDQLALVLRSLALLEARLAGDQRRVERALRERDAAVRAHARDLADLRARAARCAACRRADREADEGARAKSSRLPRCGETSSSEERASDGGSRASQARVESERMFVRKDVTRRSKKYAAGRKVNGALADDERGASLEEPRERRTDGRVEEEQRRTALACEIENVHGIRRRTSEIGASRTSFLNGVLSEDASGERPWYVNVSDPEPETETGREAKIPSNAKSQSTEDPIVGYDGGVLSAEVISAKNEILCSTLNNVRRDKFGKIKSFGGVDRSASGHGEGEEFASEPNEKWYASASDPDDAPDCEIYRHNPVLECVNQILLQNSLDESGNEHSKSSDTPSPKASTKRVQFSTLNSISFDENVAAESRAPPRPCVDDRRNKIVKFSLETASEHSYEVPNTAQGYNYEIQSIYSNDYEPIVTEIPENARPVPLPRTVATNFNASAEPAIEGSVVKNIAAKIENGALGFGESDATKIVNRKKVPRAPPALPPKPKNLLSKLKLERDPLARHPTDNSDAVAASQRVAEVGDGKAAPAATVATSEPDYCSISEINVPVVSGGQRELILSQPSVELHAERHPARHAPHGTRRADAVARAVSPHRARAEPPDAHIPMLPQVTEIIIPEEEERPHAPEPASAAPALRDLDRRRPSVRVGDSVSSILCEIERAAAERLVLAALGRPGARRDRADDEDRFDLSRNFEEFKMDECDVGGGVAEEYRIGSESSDGAGSDAPPDDLGVGASATVLEDFALETPGDATPSELDERKRALDSCRSKLSNKPDLLSNIANLETESVRNSDVESSDSSGDGGGSSAAGGRGPRALEVRSSSLAFDAFLESSGLSSKSIPSAERRRPARPALRRTRPAGHVGEGPRGRYATAPAVHDKPMTTAIKYFEPYL